VGNGSGGLGQNRLGVPPGRAHESALLTLSHRIHRDERAKGRKPKIARPSLIMRLRVLLLLSSGEAPLDNSIRGQSPAKPIPKRLGARQLELSARIHEVRTQRIVSTLAGVEEREEVVADVVERKDFLNDDIRMIAQPIFGERDPLL